MAMTIGSLLDLLTEEAKLHRNEAFESIERNKHMNDLSPADILRLKRLDTGLRQRFIDALLVDYINSVAANQCVDYGLYTEDL